MKVTPDSISKRNTGIDILRGLSILSVLLLHFNIRVPFSETYLGSLLPKMWYSLFFWSGFYGVCVFFVISGFLITTSALDKWGSLPQINLRQFYSLRFARIIPLLVLLLTLLVVLHFTQTPGFVINEERTSIWRAVLAALTFHINYLEIQVGYLPGAWDILWSLSIEETFYLFFPLVCLFVKSERNFIGFVTLFLLLSPFARTQLFEGNELGDRNHLAYIDAIAMGCIAAIVSKREWLSTKAMPWLATLGWLSVIMVFLFRSVIYKSGLTTVGLNVSLLAIGVAMVLIWMRHRQLTGQQKQYAIFRWLSFLGRNSYEVYLTHMFVVVILVSLFKKWGGSGEWIWLLYISGVVLSGLLGEVVARYFSNPLNKKLRSQLIPKIE